MATKSQLQNITDIFKNKYGKYSLSKIVPAVWFVYLLYALTFVFIDKDIPKSYYDLTIVFSSVYVGRSAIDKIQDPEKSTSTTPTQ